jgi:serine/threonine protein kinase
MQNPPQAEAEPTEEEQRMLGLADHLGEWYKHSSTIHPDVIFVVGRDKDLRRLPANRMVLAVASPLFESMLYPEEFDDVKEAKLPIEIVVPTEKSAPFEKLLSCVYSDHITLDADIAPDCLRLATKYQLHHMRMVVERAIEAIEANKPKEVNLLTWTESDVQEWLTELAVTKKVMGLDPLLKYLNEAWTGEGINGEMLLEIQAKPALMAIFKVRDKTAQKNLAYEIGLLMGKEKEMEVPSTLLQIQFKQLTLLKEIGHGSFGYCHTALWKNVKVVVKRPHAQSFDRREFMREAVMLDKLKNHPSVIRFLGACFDPASPALILEYAEEGTLETLLMKQKKFNTNDWKDQLQLIRMAAEAASGVVYLHEEKIIHRDISARNVLVTKSFQCKLNDFGMSRLLADQRDVGQTKATTGPLRWMSPESLREKSYSEKSDVWMFGVLLYEMFVRQVPYEEMSPLECAMHVLANGNTLTMPSSVPYGLRDIFASCMVLDPSKRPTMEQLHKRLVTLHGSLRSEFTEITFSEDGSVTFDSNASKIDMAGMSKIDMSGMSAYSMSQSGSSGQSGLSSGSGSGQSGLSSQSGFSGQSGLNAVRE